MSAGQITEASVDAISVVGNFRRYFDGKKMEELCANVREFGVLEPLLVRATSDPAESDFVLIAGERRLRAAKAAGLKSVPVRVLDVDEREALEIQVLENLHRENLGPIDEAMAFNTLLQGGDGDGVAKHTPETLADRVDKHVSYVYRAVRLLDLPSRAIAAIQDGTLTASHGHQILRAPADKRDEIVEWALETAKHRMLTVWELRQHVEFEHSQDLDAAEFPKNKPYAGEVSCAACPSNSGNQGLLFDGAEKGKCCNHACFKKKTDHYMEEYSKAAAGDHPGVQYLGVQVADYTGGIEGMRRARVVCGPDDAIPRETEKVLKEKPEKFGWCVLAPRGRGEKFSHVLVCLDPNVLDAKDPVRGVNQRAAKTLKTQGEKEDFVNRSIQRAIEMSVADTIKPRSRFDFTEAQWAIVVEALNTQDQPFEIAGKADRNLAQALLIRAVVYGTDMVAALKALGIDYHRVSAAVAKVAKEEWAKIQAEKGK